MAEPARRRPPVWVLVSAAWIGPAILAAFQTYVQGRLGNDDRASTPALVWVAGDWLLYGLLTPAVFWLARRIPLERDSIARRVPLHLLASIGLCAAWAGGGLLLGLAIAPGAAPPVRMGFVGWFFTSLPFGVAVYFAVLGVEHATFYFVEARERETQAARLAEQLADARLSALRMQMQPHFLFNALNAVTVTVRDGDTATATRVLERLGELLRRVIRSDRPREVPLAEELDFVRQFLEIEAVRFSDRLEPRFAVDPSLEDALVPELLLQPLVENALRHGLARRSDATRLEVGASRDGETLVLQVMDDGPGPDAAPAAPGEGVGLANTRARLETLYGNAASVTLATGPEGGATVTVRLPYRRAEAT
ncbi:MAG: sensor histidine kinase [Gemmatimonadales bacterium]